MSKPTACHDVVILDHGNAKSQHDENQAALQRILLPVFFGDMFVDRLPIQPDHDAGNTIQNTAKRYQNILKHDRLLSVGRSNQLWTDKHTGRLKPRALKS